MLVKQPHLPLISLASAFIWFTALELGALLFLAWHNAAYGMILAVISQAVARYGACRLYMWVEGRTNSAFPRSLSDLPCSLAVGFGFGLPSVLVQSTSVSLPSATSSATYYLAKCPEVSLFAYTAVISCAMFIFHVMASLLVLTVGKGCADAAAGAGDAPAAFPTATIGVPPATTIGDAANAFAVGTTFPRPNCNC